MGAIARQLDEREESVSSSCYDANVIAFWGIICLCLSVYILVWPYNLDGTPKANSWSVCICILFIGVALTGFAAYYQKRRVYLDSDGVTFHRLLDDDLTVPWSEISAIKTVGKDDSFRHSRINMEHNGQTSYMILNNFARKDRLIALTYLLNHAPDTCEIPENVWKIAAKIEEKERGMNFYFLQWFFSFLTFLLLYVIGTAIGYSWAKGESPAALQADFYVPHLLIGAIMASFKAK